MKTCSFIGMETPDKRKKVLIRRAIKKAVDDFGINLFVTGVELGSEQTAAQVVLGLKKNNTRLMLECVIKNEEQAIGWREKDRNNYFDILKRCDKETRIQSKYSEQNLRNYYKYLLDKSRYLIYAFDSQTDTGLIDHIKKTNKYIIAINMDTDIFYKVEPYIKEVK